MNEISRITVGRDTSLRQALATLDRAGTGLLLNGAVGATLVLPTTAAIFGITASSATISYMDCH